MGNYNFPSNSLTSSLFSKYWHSYILGNRNKDQHFIGELVPSIVSISLER